MNTFKRITLVSIALLVVACQTTLPETALQLPPESMQDRAMQTRRFDGISEADLLSACAGVLQDLGFNLDEAEAPLGLIVASKDRSALEPTTATIKLTVAGCVCRYSEKSSITSSDMSKLAVTV